LVTDQSEFSVLSGGLGELPTEPGRVVEAAARGVSPTPPAIPEWIFDIKSVLIGVSTPSLTKSNLVL